MDITAADIASILRIVTTASECITRLETLKADADRLGYMLVTSKETIDDLVKSSIKLQEDNTRLKEKVIVLEDKVRRSREDKFESRKVIFTGTNTHPCSAVDIITDGCGI